MACRSKPPLDVYSMCHGIKVQRGEQDADYHIHCRMDKEVLGS